MRTRAYSMFLATISLALLIVSAAAAISQHDMSKMPASGKKSQGMSHDMMVMSAMNQEPHHLLAMAYKDNLVNFAKALRHEAGQTKPINTEFARAAVAEMKRNFDQMQAHHQDHMKAMDDAMKTQMADMMKQMDTHHKAIGEFLTALDKEVQTATPDAKSVLKYVDEILKHCDGISKMHAGAMGHKMAAPKATK